MAALLLREQELHNSVDGVAAGSLSRMHPGRYQHHLLVQAKAVSTVAAHREQVLRDAGFANGLPPLLGGYRNEVDVSPLG